MNVKLKASAQELCDQRMLEGIRYASISEMAEAERVERGYLGSLLRLTLLAPEMVEAILEGRQPEGVTLPGLLEGVPVGWGEQLRTICVDALDQQKKLYRVNGPEVSMIENRS